MVGELDGWHFSINLVRRSGTAGPDLDTPPCEDGDRESGDNTGDHSEGPSRTVNKPVEDVKI